MRMLAQFGGAAFFGSGAAVLLELLLCFGGGAAFSGLSPAVLP
jgi:hypothetical protein